MKKKKILDLVPNAYILSKKQQKIIFGGDPYGTFEDSLIGEPEVCKLPKCTVQSDCSSGKICTSFSFCSTKKHCL